MKLSDKGLIALVSHEGIVPGPYYDSVGVLTYGIGHTAKAGSPDPATMPAGMPKDLDKELVEVFKVFKQDLAKYEAAVTRAFTRPLTQEQFDAAVSFHYNTGAINTATWVKTFNSGNSTLAAQQIMNWTKPAEIIPRRKAEQALFQYGTYPKASLTVWQVGVDRRVIWKPARVLKVEEALALLNPAPLRDKEGEEEVPVVTPSVVSSLLSIILNLLKGKTK